MFMIEWTEYYYDVGLPRYIRLTFIDHKLVKVGRSRLLVCGKASRFSLSELLYN